ncbi:hypothetical protein HPHPA27_1136 [Helicobacter pylori Hp A-27]|nr:hypothetical protein HPHPA27_1136 [Helicobacter pylori Hp A-27]
MPVLEEVQDQHSKAFIANIKKSPISVPSDLKKSCDVRGCSVAEIVAKLPKNQHSHKKNNSYSKEPFNNLFKDKLPKKN